MAKNNKSLQERKNLQKQINDGLKNQNNLTSQYASLLETQLNNTKEITDDIKDRVKTLNTLVQSTDKSKTLEERITLLKSKSAAIEERIKNKKAKNVKLDKFGLDLAKKGNNEAINRLRVDKFIVDSRTKALEIGKNILDNANEIDSAFGGMGNTIKGFLLNPITAAVALLVAFNSTQETIAKQFGGIGVTKFRDELAGANQNFVKLGLSGENAQSTISQIANDFGIGVIESAKLSNNVARIAASTGMSVEDSTKLVGLFTQTQGLTGQQAEDLLLGVRQLAVANNVAPDKVLSDIAANTEQFARFSKDGGENLLRAAVQARALGIDLASVAKTADDLLDFQGSLNKEIEASVLLGRDINLQKARELALAGDLEGVQKEILNVVGSEAEFNKMNTIQRQALADAVGLQNFELQKLVSRQKEQVTLQGEINRLTAENEIPEETLTGVAQILANFQSIGLELAENIGPALNGVLTFANGILEALKATVGVGPGLLAIFGGLKAHSIIIGLNAKKFAAGTIMASMVANPIKAAIGIGLGLAAVGAAVSAINNASRPTTPGFNELEEGNTATIMRGEGRFHAGETTVHKESLSNMNKELENKMDELILAVKEGTVVTDKQSAKILSGMESMV